MKKLRKSIEITELLEKAKEVAEIQESIAETRTVLSKDTSNRVVIKKIADLTKKEVAVWGVFLDLFEKKKRFVEKNTLLMKIFITLEERHKTCVFMDFFTTAFCPDLNK